jgi:spore coat protein CotF
LPNVGSNAIVSYSFEDQVDEEKEITRQMVCHGYCTPYKNKVVEENYKKMLL